MIMIIDSCRCKTECKLLYSTNCEGASTCIKAHQSASTYTEFRFNGKKSGEIIIFNISIDVLVRHLGVTHVVTAGSSADLKDPVWDLPAAGRAAPYLVFAVE